MIVFKIFAIIMIMAIIVIFYTMATLFIQVWACEQSLHQDQNKICSTGENFTSSRFKRKINPYKFIARYQTRQAKLKAGCHRTDYWKLTRGQLAIVQGCALNTLQALIILLFIIF